MLHPMWQPELPVSEGAALFSPLSLNVPELWTVDWYSEFGGTCKLDAASNSTWVWDIIHRLIVDKNRIVWLDIYRLIRSSETSVIKTNNKATFSFFDLMYRRSVETTLATWNRLPQYSDVKIIVVCVPWNSTEMQSEFVILLFSFHFLPTCCCCYVFHIITSLGSYSC